MIIYIDENMPKHLAEGFQILQFPEGLKTGLPIEIKYIPAEFHYGIKDAEWIPKVGKQKACVITQDINITRRKHELELYEKHQLGVFFLKAASKKKGLSIWQMVEALAKNWLDITQIAHKERKPFSYLIPYSKKMEKL